jgi:hypothetical protein
MEKLLFTVFKVWLFLKIGWSIFRMILLLAGGFLFFFSPLLALAVWGFILLIFLSKRSSVLERFFPQTTVVEEKVAPDLNQQIEFWEAQRTKQPTHRDILLNLAHLYAAQGNQEKALQFEQQAHEVDPNNAIFEAHQKVD